MRLEKLPMIYFLHNLITLFLATIAGLGVGSGGIYLLWLKEGIKLEERQAIFFNLLFFITALLVATGIHARKKRLDFRFLLQILLFGTPGAFFGRWINAFFSPLLLRAFLGFFLVFSGFFTLFIIKKQKEKPKEHITTLDKKAKKDYNDY